MIGPHQDKELELMLNGKKHLAIFHDVLDNEDISERVIPEISFAPYVQQGIIKRFSREYRSENQLIRYVCFTATGEEWRAAAFYWMHEECMIGRRPFDDAYEFFIGRLLNYSEEDIQDFIKHQRSFRSAVRA